MKADDIVRLFGGMLGKAGKSVQKQKQRNQSALDKVKPKPKKK